MIRIPQTIWDLLVFTFHMAASKGHFDICKLIIDNVDNKNLASNNGSTSLQEATQNGQLEICKLIIDSLVFTKK